MSNGFVVKYKDVYKLSQEYKKELDIFKDAVDESSKKIADIINNESFTGATADSVKCYLADVHITLLASMKTLAQNMQDQVALYKAGYYPIDSNTNFVLDEGAINSYKKDLDKQLGTVLDRKEVVDGAINSIQDLLYFSKPDISGITGAHNGVNSEMKTLKENTSTLESLTVQGLEGSTEVFLTYLKNSVNVLKGKSYQMVNYTPDSFFTNKDVYTLANLSEYFYTQHSENEELFNSIWEQEEELKKAAEERKTQGVWKTIGGAALVVTGVVCIVATAGAATPVVVTGAIAGGGTAAFGIADAAEGGQEIYYGSVGDIDSKSFNLIRDTVFGGNQKVYQITESVFAFTASAMVPIGAASKAHTLTFRSGSVAVGKLAISNAAGQGASKITMDLTDNRVLSMLAGMGASMLTGFTLNKIESKLTVSAQKDILRNGEHLNKDGSLKPNVKYSTGEHNYVYETDENGLLSHVEVDDLEFKTHEGRLQHDSNTIGKVTGDDAGHLIGDRFGGSPDLDNLVSQDSHLNRGEYKAMENSWADALADHKKVTVSIDVKYSAGSTRPIGFDVNYTIDGEPFHQYFNN